MQIQTSRLVLRPFREDDLGDFHVLLCDREVMKFAPTLPHKALAESRDWLRRRLSIDPAQGEDYVVEHDGQTIGKAGYLRSPEIGFLIGRAFWGKGLASEAVQAILDRGFDTHRLDKVTARVDPENLASLTLLAKFGFIETRLERRALLVGDEWRDDVHLELDAQTWSQRGSSDRGHSN